MNAFDRADTRLFHVLFGITRHHDCRVIKYVSKSGDGYFYLVLGLLLWAFEPYEGKTFLYTSILAYALELPLYVILKKLFKRQRPCDLIYNFRSHITPSDKFSLPSGHTAAAFLMASQLAHFYPAVTLVAYSWAVLIGLSRVMLGVHYPSDIVAGAALGLVISTMCLSII